MRSQIVAWGVLAVLLVSACSSGQPTPEELAAKAAKQYYDCLLAGDYEGFLQGRAGADSLSADYRDRLLKAYGHYMRQQDREHGGLREIYVSNARRDSSLSLTYAFLLLCYADSSREEIAVPMVESGGVWKMR